MRTALFSICLTLFFSVNSFGSGKTLDPLTLLTKSDAETILSMEVKDPKIKQVKERGAPSATICNYSNKDKMKGTYRIKFKLYEPTGISSGATSPPTGKETYWRWKTYIKEKAPQKKGNITEVVENVGDDAYWLPGRKELRVVSGDYYFTLDILSPLPEVSGNTNDGREQQRLGLMRDICIDAANRYILARLPK